MSDKPIIEQNTGEDSGAAPAQRRPSPPAPAQPILADWQAAAAKELKGKDVTWHTPEGIAVKPLYTAQDTAELDPASRLRAVHARPLCSMYTGRPWTIRQYAASRRPRF
jgi:methylmalonyl-CoA mutase